MTPLPPRRRQAPLLLDGAWLVTRTTEGTKEVPGMSVVADPRGFTIVGPETGRERTIPWDQTTGFTCQRPARLPDGSPATVLEVGLANGHVLELLLPVTRVPPSETVVVETELAVMSEQYGGCKPAPEPSAPVAPLSVAQTVAEPVAPPDPVAPQDPVAEPVAPPEPVSRPEPAAVTSQAPSLNGLSDGSSAPSHDSPELNEKSDGASLETPGVEKRDQMPALALRGSHSNGSSGGGSKVVLDSPVAPGPTTTSPATPASGAPPTSSLAAPASASAAAAPVSPPSVDRQPDEVATREAVGKATPAVSKPTADPGAPPEPSASNGSALRADVAKSAKSSAPTKRAAAAPVAPTAPDPVSEQAPAAAVAEAESEEAEATEAPHHPAPAESVEVAPVGEIERRENRLFTLLVALIGIVVVVLIAELVLILFVLNHNQNAKSPSVSQTTTITHVPHQTTPSRNP